MNAELENSITVKLEKVKWVINQTLDASILEGDFDVKVIEDWAKEFIVARVVGHVWGESFGGRTIRHPLNWIEAVKERWFPRWARRRWPVRYKVHLIEAKAYYPGWYPYFPGREWRIAAYVRSLEEERKRMPKYPNIGVEFTNLQADRAEIIGQVLRALTRAGVKQKELSEFFREAVRSDNPIQVCADWVTLI